MMALLDRQMAWAVKDMLEHPVGYKNPKYTLEDAGLTLDDVPSIPEAKAKFRAQFDKTMRQLKPLAEQVDQFNYTARAVEPITYRGKNRIVAVITALDRWPEPALIKVWYQNGNQGVDKFLKEWERNVGKYELEN
jgi:hypothetical protein